MPGTIDQVSIGATEAEGEFRPYGPDGRPRAITAPTEEGGSRTAFPQEVAKGEQGTIGKENPVPTAPQVKEPRQDPAVEQEVARLKAAEEKIKAHEAAHKSAGGTIAGPVSYSYTRGPDGRSYITGGEVPISVSPGRTPEETVSRMAQVIRAALAPADPSPQDRSVAAQASVQLQEAHRQTAEQGASAPDGSPVAPPAVGEEMPGATGADIRKTGEGAKSEAAADPFAVPSSNYRPPYATRGPSASAGQAVPRWSDDAEATGPTHITDSDSSVSTLRALDRTYGNPVVTGFTGNPSPVIAVAV